jgi:hypothetical protein
MNVRILLGPDPTLFISYNEANTRWSDSLVATPLVDETRLEGEHVYRAIAWRVPESEAYPEGIKYRFHYGTFEGETILRYDNSHGVHERHTPTGVSIVEFVGLWEHYRRFRLEVERL